MKENILVDLSKQFAVDIVNLCTDIKENRKSNILLNQVLRSGTSIGANIKEGAFAQTKADLIAKLFIAQKECAETEYWLELLYESGYIPKDDFAVVHQDCQELLRILVASTKTLQGKSSGVLAQRE